MAKAGRLHCHLAEMVALEVSTGDTLQRLATHAAIHTETSALLNDFCAISRVHRQALRGRLEKIAPGARQPDVAGAEATITSGSYPASSALRSASAALNEAIISYAMLRTIALRNRDSILSGEENTGDLAEKHARNYAAAVHRINQVLHNVVIWEMDKDGETCKCTCPSCGLGVCLCAQAPRRTLSDTWAELGPISTDTSVTVQKPEATSPAASAGLQAGDVILAADGQELESHFALQGVISGHQSGEAVELRVRRLTGEIENIAIVLP